MKKAFTLLFLLAVLAGFYAITTNAKADDHGPTPTASRSPTANPLPTAPAETCRVHTGVDNGTVNLRECKGVACGAVLDILTEGSSLTILTTGEWIHGTTAGGVTGWLNSKYCKETNP
jgi:hypothetical protein